MPLLAGPLKDATGSPQAMFAVLLGLTAVSTGWFSADGWATKAKRVPARTPEPATALAV